MAVTLWNPERQKQRNGLPPTGTAKELAKRTAIERFFGRVLVFFRLQRPPVFGWSAVEIRVALTYAAVWVIASAAWQDCRPDLLCSPRRVLAHVGRGGRMQRLHHGRLARMEERRYGETNLQTAVMSPALGAAISAQYALSFQLLRQLSGGEECEIWLARSEGDLCVVRISPRWRSLTQLGWVHALLLATRPLLPVVIAPLMATNGSTLFLHKGHPVALFPYVDGHFLDREDPAQRRAAAQLLAQLHRAMLTVSVPDTPPRRHLREAPPGPRMEDAAPLQDPELDAWHAALLRQPVALTCGPIHGDYYRRNVLVSGSVITAILDWDDAHPDFLMQEVAWSAWEFSKTTSGDDWHSERAHAFVQAYRAAGGPCTGEEYTMLLPFIRWRLREEVRYNLAAAAVGERWDPEYVDKEVRAFQQLRGQTFAV